MCLGFEPVGGVPLPGEPVRRSLVDLSRKMVKGPGGWVQTFPRAGRSDHPPAEEPSSMSPVVILLFAILIVLLIAFFA